MRVTYTLQKGDTLYQIAHYYQTTVAELLALNPTLNPQNLRVGDVIIVREGEIAAPQEELNTQTRVQNAMRKAWTQHVYWSKILLTSISDRLRDAGDVSARLMQNPIDIVAVFSRFFPREANIKLTRLLTEHVELCTALYLALRDGQDISEIVRAWNVNSDKIATLLATFNSKYNYNTIKEMLDTHLSHVLNGASLRLQNKYIEEIEAFNRSETDTLIMADYLAENLG